MDKTKADAKAPPESPERWDGPAILALALLVRLLLLLQLRARDPFFAFTVDGFDQRTYQDQASDILGGDLLLRKWWLFYYTPLYSYFCAAVYALFGKGAFGALHFFQALIGAGCAWMVHALARTWLRRGEALAAGAMAALCPAWLFYEQQLLVEGLELAAAIAALLLLRRAELAERASRRAAWLLGAGVVSAIAYIGRGSFALVILAFAAWLAARPAIARQLAPADWKRAAAMAGIYLLGVFVGVAPLALRNRAVTGLWKFGTANGAANLYLGNAADSKGVFDYSPRFMEAQKLAAKDPGIYMRMLREDVRKAPGRVARNLLRKFRFFFNGLELSDNASLEIGKSLSFLLRWNPLAPRALLALGLLGFAIAAPRWREPARISRQLPGENAKSLEDVGISRSEAAAGISKYVKVDSRDKPNRFESHSRLQPKAGEKSGQSLLWVFAAAFAASIILVFPTGRYRIPIYAPMIIAAAQAGGWAVGAARGKRFARLGAAAVGLGVVWLALAPVRKPPTRLEDCKIYLLAAMQQKKFSPAARMLRVAKRDYPKRPEIVMHEYWLLVETGAWEEAREFWAARLEGESALMAEAYFARAKALLHDGDRAGARRILEEILRANPKFAPARELLRETEAQ